MAFFVIAVIAVAAVICIHYSNLATEAIMEKRKLQREVNSLKAQIAELAQNGAEVSSTAKPAETVNSMADIKSEEVQTIKEVGTTITSATEKIKEKIIEHKVEKKNEVSEQEKKNTTILATGAILVVLAAIVFLSSTWSLLSNVTKTIGLLLFLGVFLGASKISEEKYHLEKASKTFFYLAMAYVPIFLISISLFGLLGEFLSIYGDGVYIYFFISASITALTYYYFYNTRSDIILFYGSILAQAAAMVLLVLIFSNDIRLIMLVLLAYNIVLAVLCSFRTYKLLENIVKVVSYIALALSFVIVIESNWLNVPILVLLAVNYLILYLKSDNDTAYAFFFNAALCAAGAYWIFAIHKELDISTQMLMAILYNVTISVIESLLTNNPKRSGLQMTTSFVNIIAIACLYIFAKMHMENALIVLIIEGAYLFYSLFMNKESITSTITNYAIPTVIFLALFEWGELTSIMSFAWIILILCVVGELCRNTKYDGLTRGCMTVGGIVWIFDFFLLMEAGLFTDKIILMAVSIYYLFRTKKSLYKYLSYLAMTLLIFKDMRIDIIENWKYIVPAISTLIVAMLETSKPSIKDDYSNYFIALGAAISYICLLLIKSDVSIIIAIPFSAVLYFYYVAASDGKSFRLVPLIGLMISIRMISDDLMMLELWEIIYVVILTLITISTGKISYETLCSGVMLFCFLGYDIEEKIVSAALFVLWSILNLINATGNEKIKDVFLGCTILSITYFYYTLVTRLGITDKYMYPLLIGISIAAFVFMEKIVKKYVTEDLYLVIEYVVYGCICVSALSKYKSEIDGMFFVLFWIVLAAVSYKDSKNGRFLVSIIAILVNAFLLTRDFWFSLPWWVYLLFAGIGMIGFAVKNEFNSNRESKSNLDSNENVYIGHKDDLEDKK